MGQFDEALAKLHEASAALDRLHDLASAQHERAVIGQRASLAQARIAEAVKLLSDSQRHKEESHHNVPEKSAITEKPAAGKKP